MECKGPVPQRNSSPGVMTEVPAMPFFVYFNLSAIFEVDIQSSSGKYCGMLMLKYSHL